jgi:TATA-binding protein-associated factor
LQKFKLNIANTVISQENAGLSTMNTDQLLDLFQLTDTTENAGKKPEKVGDKASMKDVLGNLEELWDARQYQEEYDIDAFLESLK